MAEQDADLVDALQSFMQQIADEQPRPPSTVVTTPTAATIVPLANKRARVADGATTVILDVPRDTHRIDQLLRGELQNITGQLPKGRLDAKSVRRQAANDKINQRQGRDANNQQAVPAKKKQGWIRDEDLGAEQLRGLRMIMDETGTRLSGRNCFVTGAGGSGKSFLISALVQRWRKYGITYRITGTTGVAASLVRGTTFHKFMRMGLMQHPIGKLRMFASRNRELAADWAKLQVLIIDEISMWQPRQIRTLDAIGRALRPAFADQPFGGVQVIFVGDFFQLKPVFTSLDRKWAEQMVKECGGEATPEGLAEADNLKYDYVFEHPLWQQYIGTHNVVSLSENFRVGKGDPLWGNILSEMRRGRINADAHRALQDRNIETLMFPDTDAMRDPVTGIRPTEIYATNEEADRVNQREYDKIWQNDPTKRLETYKYQDIRIGQDISKETKEIFDLFIDTMYKDYLARPEVNVCIGSQVMLLHNLDVARGLTNGVCGVVQSLSKPIQTPYDAEPRRYPCVRFVIDEVEIVETILPRALECSHEDKRGAQCFYVQVPLRLADGSSVHKIQGQSLDRIYGDVAKMNKHGQAYTFYSRVRSLRGLFHVHYSRDNIIASPKVLAYYDAIERAFAAAGA